MVRSILKRIMRLFLFLTPFFSKKSHLDSDTARKTITECSPKPEGTPIRANTLLTPTCDLQIIVPAYNVEAYLEECIDSILTQQTKYSFKIVLVDDGSKDKTGEVADRYLDNEKVLVIHQSNQGHSGARNTGLKEIFAKYVMFVDSDDKLCPGAIEALMNAAIKHDSDIAEAGIYFWVDGKTRVAYAYPEEKEIPTALGVLHGYSVAKVFKAECFENLIYPEGFWYEDSIFSFLLYPLKKRISVSDKMTYLYRLHRGGITTSSKGKPKAVDSYWVTELLMDIARQWGVAFNDAFFEKYLRQIVLNQKRIARLPEQVQESAFILSADLMCQYFSPEVIQANQRSKIARALTAKDWGMFKFYCKFTAY